ncbi:MAG: iron-containing alcohol dehydrogenase [Planctomycetales bacterium]|nr:iron-containing alcohol dehydrogenase [Planctomycetales bacterium]
MRTTWNFHTAGQLVFGNGAARQLGTLLAKRNLHRAFVVTDRHLIAAEIAPRVLQSLTEASLSSHLFDEGAAEPSIEVAVKAAERAKTFNPDCIVGLGGGSNMDLAKIVAVLVTHGGSPENYFSFGNVPGPVLPLVCVPTTAGTGSEVSHAAVLTDTANKMKVSTLSNFLRPALAVVDPELTYTCPPKVTADSGIDALTHAIEAYTAIDYPQLDAGLGDDVAYQGKHPLGDCLAEKAISLIGQHLVAVVKDGNNKAAREGMALAATLAGMAFSNCAVALVHALEYPLGGAIHVSHGAGNGLLLPYVMRFNLPERKAAFARIAELLGENISGLSEDAAAEKAISAVDRIRSDIGIPHRIRDIGGKREQLPEFATKAFAIKRLMAVNPRRTSEADLLEILEAAF